MRFLLLRSLCVLPVMAIWCLATDPRKQATDYPAHAESEKVALGAEYLVHSVPTGHETFFLPGYLVVDTAIYPKGGEFKIEPRAFHLRLNGKVLLETVAPQMVAYAMQFSPANSGAAFPGAPTNRPQPVPQAPDVSHPDGPPPGPESPADALPRLALQEGEYHSPQGGFLYFSFSGKLKTIKSLELIYSGKDGDVEVQLF